MALYFLTKSCLTSARVRGFFCPLARDSCPVFLVGFLTGRMTRFSSEPTAPDGRVAESLLFSVVGMNVPFQWVGLTAGVGVNRIFTKIPSIGIICRQIYPVRKKQPWSLFFKPLT
jgi:hypothetical protein